MIQKKLAEETNLRLHDPFRDLLQKWIQFPLTIKKKYYIINLCLKYKDKFRS